MAIPQLVQYQGSKRKLAPSILRYIPSSVERIVEPFCGMAAVSVAASQAGLAHRFLLNDINEPIVQMIEAAVNSPRRLAYEYEQIWSEQFDYENHVNHFYDVRERYNSGDHSPAVVYYLLARCVKGAVRYSRDGQFNQSPDKRRHGASPDRARSSMLAVSDLLRSMTHFKSRDFTELLGDLKEGDLVYLDPPYQGVSDVRDHRYIAGVKYEKIVEYLKELDRKGVDYILSYDGMLGDKEYGKAIPSDVKCERMLLDAGRSSQATLLGKDYQTTESLYVSHSILEKNEISPSSL